jgi:hypothetical protein
LTSAPTAAPILSEKTFAEAAAGYTENGGDARFLDPIVEYFGNRPLASIYPFDVTQMAKMLLSTQHSATRNRQALTPARAVINHGYDRGWRNLIPIKKLKEEPGDATATSLNRLDACFYSAMHEGSPTTCPRRWYCSWRRRRLGSARRSI